MFNFEEFLADVQSQFSDIPAIEIRGLLELDYDKDAPESLGKRLIINRLRIAGQKQSGEAIDYDKTFYSGVNVLFADNGKGKSSVFKILKFCLTGDKSSIKNDVQKWLKEITCEFNIGSNVFTVYINMESTRTASALYRMELDELIQKKQNGGKIESLLIDFEVKTETAFRQHMQDFFFKQFSYYTLTWTSGTKGSIDLNVNQTSWKSYYKSIYLESKDYGVLFLNEDFGSQNKKILEMILGLKLTSGINLLAQKKDQLNNLLQKSRFLENQKKDTVDTSILFSELTQTNNEIDDIQKKQREAFRKSLAISEYKTLAQNLKSLEEELLSLKSQKETLKRDILQIKRKVQRFEEDLEFGFYFSNLDIHICPRCEHSISSAKRDIELELHKCMLCDEELDKSVDREILESQIEKFREEQQALETAYSQIKGIIADTEREIVKLTHKMAQVETRASEFNLTDWDLDRLSDLIAKRIELQHQMGEQGNNTEEPRQLDRKIRMLDYAIRRLGNIRFQLSQDILSSLGALILGQLHDFGLTNVTEVQINDNMELLFIQNGEPNKFHELNEGEQLRAKIAFFVSLILLDIKYSVGRHPRLLIIDSPGKEEVISKDLVGLAGRFRGIEQSHERDLQIIIGTALHELKAASTSTKVDSRENGEAVF